MKILKYLKIKKIFFILILLMLVVPITFSRYIYTKIHNAIIESNGFYFYSSVLTENGSSFNIDNWDGVNDYVLTIDVTNVKNAEIYSLNDIYYDIGVECSDDVVCTLDKTQGVIFSSIKVDSYQITVEPTSQIRRGEYVTVRTYVESTSPYVKRLSAEYSIGVTNENFTYKIDDSQGEKYMTLDLTNNVSYYKVDTAFGTYSVGDTISLESYNELTSSEKEKCYSAQVELTFDPNDIYLDTTDSIYINNISYDTTTIGGNSYINKIKFNMEANQNKKIIFYKKVINNDYTYPIVTSTPKVGVSVVTATT